MSRFNDCPVMNESPDPCPKCGATVSGNDPVNGVCQAGETWDRATAAERERCAKIADAEADEYQRQVNEWNTKIGLSGYDQEEAAYAHRRCSTARNIAGLIRLTAALSFPQQH